MLSIVCNEPGSLALEEREERSPSEGYAKVKIQRIGVCGTDYHIYEGLHPFLEYPRVMGHELAGEIAEVAPGSSLSVGDKVIINPYVPCGKCIACRKGKPNCCVSVQVFGVHTDGGMCEYLNVPEAHLYSAEGLSLDQAVMTEFLAIGAHGVRRAEIEKNDRVLVVGAGPIGLGAAMFSNIAGAKVFMLDLSEARIARAQNLIPGITGISSTENLDETIAELTNGDLFDVVIDATGNKHAMQNSFKFVAHGGSLLFISVVKDDITFNDPLFHSREMRLIGSRNATREDFEHVIQCLKDGLIPTEKLLTHRSSMQDAVANIPEWLHQQDTLVKAVIEL